MKQLVKLLGIALLIFSFFTNLWSCGKSGEQNATVTQEELVEIVKERVATCKYLIKYPFHEEMTNINGCLFFF